MTLRSAGAQRYIGRILPLRPVVPQRWFNNSLKPRAGRATRTALLSLQTWPPQLLDPCKGCTRQGQQLAGPAGLYTATSAGCLRTRPGPAAPRDLTHALQRSACTSVQAYPSLPSLITTRHVLTHIKLCVPCQHVAVPAVPAYLKTGEPAVSGQSGPPNETAAGRPFRPE